LLVSVQKTGEKRLIPELCYLTGVPERAKRDGNTMRQVRDSNNSKPNDRYNAIKTHAEKMTSGKFLNFAQNQQLVVETPSLQVQAFELPAVKIVLKSETLEVSDRPFNVNGLIKQAVAINILRIFHQSSDSSNAQFLEKILRERLKASGVPIEVIDYEQYSSFDHLHELLSSIRSTDVVPSIILVIIPRRDQIYSEIKQLALNADLPVQCILSSQFRNEGKIKSVLSNLTHQIAAKTGSQIWTVPHCEGIPKITMVVGMDVHHDTVNQRESVLGFSASLNPDFTKYYSTIRKQAKVGEEISAAVEDCFKEAIVNFYEETKKRFLPSLIIVFRDGVSDSQEDLVRSIEVAGLKKIIAGFQGYDPEIIYMVVRKGIDQRFFQSNKGQYWNPKAGTVILDPMICDDSTFYLITSTVTQGNAAPVKYRIIENTSNVSKAVLAKFSYGLSHLYYNWKGAIKIPAPIQLSHKIAYIVGENVHRDASMNLRKSLWYL
jgi:aubergine-like protein